jgi:hypothetical protein
MRKDEITIKLVGNLKNSYGTKENNGIIKLNFTKNLRISDILSKINIPKEYIALIIINKKISNAESEVKASDKIDSMASNSRRFDGRVEKKHEIFKHIPRRKELVTSNGNF